MVKAELPKIRQPISITKFHVSKFNVNFGEPFGQSEKDQILIMQVSRTKKIVEPFKARVEGQGYGVYTGRRRFLALKAAGVKTVVVGSDVLIVDLNEEQARRDSLIENLKILRLGMNPITRANQLNELVSSSPDGLKGTARRLGLSQSTLSEWLRILDLHPRMQEAIAKGLIYYTDGLRIAKMKLGQIAEDKLAETLETEGLDGFHKEVERFSTRTLKRGIPKGKYFIERITFDKYYEEDMNLYETLQKLAKNKNMQLNDYIKKEIIEPYVKSQA